MSIQIGSMLRAMLGEVSQADSRALELRIGQIVRGVLMEMLDNGEALMNIGGVQVRAKLEADLPVGRGTLLQVQPGSGGGTVMLKPLADVFEALPDETLKTMLKSFGLPDQKWAFELMRGLKRDGYAIGKEAAAFFQSAASLKPAGTDMASWMAAADVVFRRGLNATEETIASLRQTLFGQPLHEGLADLASALKSLAASSEPKSPRLAELAVRLQTLLAEGERLLTQGEAQLQGGTVASRPDGQLAGKPAAAFSPAAELPKANAAAGGLNGDGAAGGGPATPQDGARQSAASASVPGQAGQAADTAAAAAHRLAAAVRTQAAAPAGVAQVPPDGQVPAEEAASTSQARPPEPQLGSIPRESATGAQHPATVRGESSAWLGRFLQWLGAGHEHRLLDDAGVAATGPMHDDRPPAAESARPAADTLKSVLLALAAQDDAPPALREAAQSLVNQITGQQLLLSSERQANNPFSMMTLFVPMKGPDGDTTATVHVQARRSRKGEWDTDNCRLLFDLRMRHLGETVVDVQVVDRIVSVKLMNQYPGMTAMVEQARDSVAAGMRDAGFQLLSLTAAPLPSWKEAASSESGGERPDQTDAAMSASYSAKPYKGVDFRV